MSNQTLDLQIEGQLIESDLESSLLSDNEANLVESDLPLELATNLNSTDNLDLFADSEEASLLYSQPLAMESDHSESPEHDELPEEDTPEMFPDEGDTDTPTEESDTPLTNSVTVGDPGGTQFTFNFAEDTPQKVIDGVVEAGENWTSVLTDDVDINIDFTFNPSEPGNLGGAIPEYLAFDYEFVNEALANDVTSTNDQFAIANLPEGNLDILINNTSENNGSDTPYLDDNGGFNNSNVIISKANAKALGIGLEDLAEDFGITVEQAAQVFTLQYPEFTVDPNSADASLNFNSDVNWDFDGSDGIGSDSFDFVGVVTHEIGHALGFLSGAEFLDTFADPDSDFLDLINSTNSEELQELIAGTFAGVIADGVAFDQFISENEYLLQPFDFFRYTSESLEQGAIDFTTGNIDGKYFSIDGGQTVIAPLSEGRETGADMQQLSHWEDNLGIGIMDPTFAPGELGQITEEDLLAFDVIGWDLA